MPARCRSPRTFLSNFVHRPPVPITVTAPASLRGAAMPLRALVRTALSEQGCVAGDIGVVLADDALLRSLNRRYRGKDRATDVLSFEYVTEAATSGGRVRAPRI